MGMLVVATGDDGESPVFINVHDARYFIDGEWRGSQDALIRDLTDIKRENIELLAENTRLRRRLEKGR